MLFISAMNIGQNPGIDSDDAHLFGGW
jgi:hypothetical protein